MFRNSKCLQILQTLQRLNSPWIMKFSAKPSSKVTGFKTRPEVDEKHDYIGPPDINSNIRPIVRRIPINETPLQLELRLRRAEVEKWNHEFWANHNKRFYDEKEVYVKKMQKPNEEAVGADTMSVFYKEFLDKNWPGQVNGETFIRKFRKTPKNLN